MNAEEAGMLVVTMQAAWPGFAKSEPAAQLWTRQIARLERDVADHAIRSLIETRDRPPTIADLQDAARGAQRHLAAGRRALPQGRCELCEGHGWEFVSNEGHGSVRRCRRGCAANPEAVSEDPRAPQEAVDREMAKIRDILDKASGPLAKGLRGSTRKASQQG